uniref:aralkylamine N-acetyltransferase n=1 Tax=Drosophila rhopaloa TaxID=1041015 RepID=A0A6P4FM02_DRORH
MTSNSKDGITIRIMLKEDFANVKAFMKKEYFASEPLCQSSGETDCHLQIEKENDVLIPSMIAQGTCLVALDEKNGGRLVGLVLAEARFPKDLETNRIKADAMENNVCGRIYVMLSKIEREANLFERFGISKVLYSDTTSVDTSMRGKGLGSRLAATLMDVGRSKGFPAMVAYCTSYYSARQKAALGMQCIHSIVYADYKDDQGRPIFTPAEPHTMLRLMAIKL